MKVKLLNGVLPTKSREGDAGFDLYAPYSTVLPPGERYQIKLGIAIEIGEDEVALIQGRSGLALNQGITTIGNVIDSNYRGEISAIILNTSSRHVSIPQNSRVAQLLVLRLGQPGLEVVEELTNSPRGDQGFGSSGL